MNKITDSLPKQLWYEMTNTNVKSVRFADNAINFDNEKTTYRNSTSSLLRTKYSMSINTEKNDIGMTISTEPIKCKLEGEGKVKE